MSSTEARPRKRGPRKTTGSAGEAPRLVQAVEVARTLAISPTTLKRWVADGAFPEPHSIVHRTWFYRRDWVDAYVATARWPEGARFRRSRAGEGGGSS